MTNGSQDPLVVVSTSGGKDSTATLLVAIERVPRDRIYPVFADTGNEHPLTYQYLGYLETTLGLKITRLREDFSEWWVERREYIRAKWPEKGVSPEVVARALTVFDKGPTGNPFLDLCILKGRFPSRMAQFCTDFLKKRPINRFTDDLVLQHGRVESWQGVRADESENRAKLPERESGGELFEIYRPILRWTVEQVFEKHKEHGIEPNPLYKLGMGRVGCMPCINCSKDELLAISQRFPEHIDRIEEWEKIVAEASKRGNSTFFPSPEDRGDGKLHDIRNRTLWAKTARGGVNLDIFRASDEVPSCSSRYGLCE